MLTAIMLAGPVFSEVDTSPYYNLQDQISQIEEDLETANEQDDVQLMINLTRKKDKLTDHLSTPRMQFLRTYSKMLVPLEEARYLSGQMDVFPPGSLSEAKSGLQETEQAFSNVEVLYNSAEYDRALSEIQDLRYDISSLPASLASEFSSAIEDLKSEMERGSQVTPSTLSMLDNAGQKFLNAKNRYTSASSKLLSGSFEAAEEEYQAGHEISEKAFSIISRAKESTGQILDWVKLTLILGPVVMVVALIIYFKLQFRKSSSIKSRLSQARIKAGEPLELERTIEFSNSEKKPVPLRIKERLPSALVASDFSMPPSETVGNELTWAFQAKPGKTKINYKLSSTEPIKEKSKIRIPGASVSYEVDGTEKKAVSSAQDVMAI